MKRIETFRRVTSAVGLTLGAAVARYTDSVLANYTLPGPLQIFVFFVVMLCIYLVTNYGASAFVDASPRLRRFILGKYFVEGTWMDVLRVNGTPTYVGLLRIEYDSGTLSISGRNFNRNGVVESSFNSDIAAFEWPRLLFKYSASRSPEGEHNLEGFAHVRFVGRDGSPLSYDGYYRDHAGNRAEYSGWKVTEKDKLASLDKPEDLKDQVTSMWKGVSPSSVNTPSRNHE